jgi:hypothetical protein
MGEMIGFPSSQPKQRENMESLILALIATRMGYKGDPEENPSLFLDGLSNHLT